MSGSVATNWRFVPPHTLLFVNDYLVIATDTDDVRYVILNLNDEYKNWSLESSFQKTEYLVISAENLNNLNLVIVDENLNIEGKVIRTQ